MKKIILIAALVMSLSSTAMAQVKFGVKGGVNVTNMSLSSEVLDKSNNAGFFIGPTVKFTLPIVGLGIDGSLLYDQRSAEVSGKGTGNTVSTKLKSQQLVIPVNARYDIGLGETASLLLFTGPQFGFNLSDDVDEIDWKWKNTSFSWNFGAGVMLLNHLQLSANYNLSLGKTGEFSIANAVKEGVGDGKEHAWQIGLAYYF